MVRTAPHLPISTRGRTRGTGSRSGVVTRLDAGAGNTTANFGPTRCRSDLSGTSALTPAESSHSCVKRRTTHAGASREEPCVRRAITPFTPFNVRVCSGTAPRIQNCRSIFTAVASCPQRYALASLPEHAGPSLTLPGAFCSGRDRPAATTDSTPFTFRAADDRHGSEYARLRQLESTSLVPWDRRARLSSAGDCT